MRFFVNESSVTPSVAPILQRGPPHLRREEVPFRLRSDIFGRNVHISPNATWLHRGSKLVLGPRV